MKFAEVMKTEDWKKEKHVPVIECADTVAAGEVLKVTLSVGKEISHPNKTEHHIRWIKLYFMPEGGNAVFEVSSADFAAHGESGEGPDAGPVMTDPCTQVCLRIKKSGTLIATAYCNIHGVWESSKSVKVQ